MAPRENRFLKVGGVTHEFVALEGAYPGWLSTCGAHLRALNELPWWHQGPATCLECIAAERMVIVTAYDKPIGVVPEGMPTAPAGMHSYHAFDNRGAKPKQARRWNSDRAWTMTDHREWMRAHPTLRQVLGDLLRDA